MKNILFTSNKVHTTARIGVLFFSLCFSPLINAGNAEKPMNGIENPMSNTVFSLYFSIKIPAGIDMTA